MEEGVEVKQRRGMEERRRGREYSRDEGLEETRERRKENSINEGWKR